MSTPNHGGLAFPRTACEWNSPQEGMTLRDYFAAKAMQAFCVGRPYTNDETAKQAYQLANAMIERRQRQ